MKPIDLFVSRARACPDTPAIVDLRTGTAATFAELEDTTARAAAMLLHEGLCRGDGALVLVPMSLPLYEVLIAVLRAGVAAVFVEASADRALIEQCCRRYPVSGFIGAPAAHALRLRCPSLRRAGIRFAIPGRVPGARSWRAHIRHNGVEAAGGEGDALVTFTSGTTGTPKIAVRTHDFLAAQHAALEGAIAWEPGTRVLTTFPIFALSHLASGVTTVIPGVDLRRADAVDARRLVDEISEHGVEGIATAPALLDRVARCCASEGRLLDGVKRVFVGGGPVFPSLIERLSAIAPNAEITALYGSTEAEPVSLVSADRIRAAAGMPGVGLPAGAPVPGIEVRILLRQPDADVSTMGASEFDARCAPPGVAGEIVVAGRHVLGGYHGGVGDAENKIEVGGRRWHRTGDAGRLDGEGQLWLLGRCGAVVRDSRGEVYPFTVEAVACSEPGIHRAAFVSHKGRRVLLLQADPRAGSAVAERLQRILSWAAVDRVVFCERIPVDRRHNSKIDYPQIERLLDRMHAPEAESTSSRDGRRRGVSAC